MQSLLECVLAVILFVQLVQVSKAREANRWCAACMLVVDEINYEISKTDPHKVLEEKGTSLDVGVKNQVEGFRVDPRGNQKNKKIPYVRSETHLTEITESLCNRMNEFLESTSPDGRITYVPSKSRDGKPLKLENVSMSGATAERLRHMCNTIIEDQEDTIIDFFRAPMEHPKMEFCALMTNYCESTNMDLFDKDEL